MKSSLPPRLQQLLKLAAEGMPDKQIAIELGISLETVMSHWKRLRAHFEASSRTEIVSRVLQTQHGDELNALQEQRDQLLYEIAQRERAEAQLKEVVAQLEVEVQRRAKVLNDALAASSFHSAEAKKHAASREELAKLIADARLIVHSGRYGGGWEKYYASDSVNVFGYSPEDWVGGKVNIFDVSIPEDMVEAVSSYDQVPHGVRKLLVPHWFYSAEREPYLMIDFLFLGEPDVFVAGDYYGLTLDVTEWMEPLFELFESGRMRQCFERRHKAMEERWNRPLANLDVDEQN